MQDELNKAKNKSISLTNRLWAVVDQLSTEMQKKRSELFRDLLIDHLRDTGQLDLLAVDQQEGAGDESQPALNF